MRALSATFIVFTLAACPAPSTANLADADQPFDAAVSDGCAPPSIWRYEQPGCGAAASASCGSATMDLCLSLRCSCAGKVIGGCDYFSEAWTAGPVATAARVGDPCSPPDLR